MFSACTDAIPSDKSPITTTATGLVFGSADNSNAIDCLTRKVNEFAHFFTLKCVTVIGAWQAAVNSFSGATLAKRVVF